MLAPSEPPPPQKKNRCLGCRGKFVSHKTVGAISAYFPPIGNFDLENCRIWQPARFPRDVRFLGGSRVRSARDASCPPHFLVSPPYP